MACPAPDALAGTVVRLSNLLECNAQLLGREGFLAVAGFSTSSGLVTAVLTIFVALIGYRLLMGSEVGVRDVTGWVMRAGIVLALITGWPVFQTLFYDVAVAGPQDLALRLSASIDVSGDNQVTRVQRVYDVLRLGTAIDPTVARKPGEADPIESSIFKFQPPMPNAATLFLLATAGLTGAIKIVTAFLLAIAPVPILAILFAPTYGLFIGWLRALLAAAFASVAVIFVSGLHLFAVDAEISRIQASIGTVNAARLDAQAVVPIILVFLLVTLGLIFAAGRLSGALAAVAAPSGKGRPNPHIDTQAIEARSQQMDGPQSDREKDRASDHQPGNARVISVSDALHDAMRREQASAQSPGSVGAGGEQTMETRSKDGAKREVPGRRLLGRQHRSATRRDRAL